MNRFLKASLCAALIAAPAMADEVFGGIGVSIYRVRNGIEVAEIIPGGPASETKLQVGDQIISVDGQSLKYMPFEDCKNLLRGQVNKPVEITFISGADTLSTVIRRARLTVKDLNGDDVRSWYGSDSDDFETAELENYATAKDADMQLLAVLQNGYLIKESSTNTDGLNGVYVDRAEEFAPKVSNQVEAASATVLGVSRKAIGLELQSAGVAVVTIMDPDGGKVATLRLDEGQPGFNTLTWNGEKVPAGRYMVIVEHNGTVSGKNAVLR